MREYRSRKKEVVSFSCQLSEKKMMAIAPKVRENIAQGAALG